MSPSHPPTHSLLRRAEQAAAGGLVALSLTAIVLWCLAQRRLGQRLIDLDQAAPHPVPLQVDLNEAPWPELALLPGIGPQLARRIVADRQVRGPFRDVEDLRRVKGIGPVTLERIRPYVQPPPERQTVAKGGQAHAAPASQAITKTAAGQGEL